MPWNVGKDGKATIAISAQEGGPVGRLLPAYLSAGPPVLLNPERVVPFSEQSRYERHFQPNVALAPLSHQLSSTSGAPSPPRDAAAAGANATNAGATPDDAATSNNPAPKSAAP